MATLRKTELSEVVSELPDIGPFDPKAESSGRVDDLFLCALGFEERCLTLPRRLAEAGYRCRLAVYLIYSTNADDNEKNKPALLSHLRSFAEQVQDIEADSPDSANRLQTVVKNIADKADDGHPSITFDISVTANRSLVRCMKVLLQSDIVLRVLYSEAATYHPTKEEYDKNGVRWARDDVFGLERGVSNVIVSRDHPGHHLDPIPDCIVLFPTFKSERSRAAIAFLDPSLLTSPGDKVLWLLGIPHLPEDAWRLGAMRVINDIADDVPKYEVSTFEYKDTLQRLEAIHEKMSEEYKLSIAPFGSKMQALGTSLFHHLHPDVRVIFAIPKEYNAAQYSGGCRATWKIDFGSIPDLRERLNRVGTLVIED